MADEKKTTLLQSLTTTRGLPVRKDERELEPVEHEQSNEVETGRAPEEVVQARETPETTKEVAPRTYKVQIDDGTGNPVVREMTIQQLGEEGLLDKIITTSNQFPTIQKKYQDLLESRAKPESKEETKAVVPAKREPPTPVQIRQIYDKVVAARVQAGYIEPDFAEAYPDLAASLVYNQDIIEDLSEKLGHCIAWIQAEVEVRNSVKVNKMLDDAIEGVAVRGDGDKGDIIFKPLRDPQRREEFKTWIIKTVDPKVGALSAENAEKWWFAFNSGEILAFAKESANKAKSPTRQKAASDGTSTRAGGPTPTPKEPTLLDRMSSTRLGAEA